MRWGICLALCLLLGGALVIYGLRRQLHPAGPAGGEDDPPPADEFARSLGGGARDDFSVLRGGSGDRLTRRQPDTVEQALRWLQREQIADGRWSSGGPVAASPFAGGSSPVPDVALPADPILTAGALLSYLGAGYDQRVPSVYRKTIARGVDWLLERQGRDGGWGDNHPSALATMALAEAYAMTNDPRLREPAQRGLDFLLSRQNPGPGANAGFRGGWSPDHPDPRHHDTFTTLWCTMALKSGKVASLDTGAGLEGARWWLETTWRRANPAWEKLDDYQDDSRFPAVYDAVADRVSGDGCEGFGLLAAVFLGLSTGEVLPETLANRVVVERTAITTSWPTGSPRLYCCHLGLFQLGGERWRKWQARVRKMLAESQCDSEGVPAFAGSWDPTGAAGTGSAAGERTMITIYNTMTLETYYCGYLPVEGSKP